MVAFLSSELIQDNIVYRQFGEMKNPARNDRRGDLALMKGTDAKKLVQTFP